MEITSVGEPRAKIGEVDIAEFVARGNRQFERGAFQMVDEDFQIVRLDEGMLGSVAEEIVRVANDKLIERRRGTHQHGPGASAATAGAAAALPGGGGWAGRTSPASGFQAAA